MLRDGERAVNFALTGAFLAAILVAEAGLMQVLIAVFQVSVLVVTPGEAIGNIEAARKAPESAKFTARSPLRSNDDGANLY